MSGKPPPRPHCQVFAGRVSDDDWRQLMMSGDIISSASWYSPSMQPNPRPHDVVSTRWVEGLSPTRGGGSGRRR